MEGFLDATLSPSSSHTHTRWCSGDKKVRGGHSSALCTQSLHTLPPAHAPFHKYCTETLVQSSSLSHSEKLSLLILLGIHSLPQCHYISFCHPSRLFPNMSLSLHHLVSSLSCIKTKTYKSKSLNHAASNLDEGRYLCPVPGWQLGVERH